jgi:serine/threonine protein kinase
MLFEMVCRRRPFVNEDPLDTVRAHMLAPPPKPRSLAPEISDQLDQVILRSLAKEPEARYQTADAFIAALAACPDGSRLAPRRRRPQRVRQIAAGAAMLVGLVLAVRWFWIRPAAPPPAPPSAPLMMSHDAEAHLSLAADYQRKLWCSDAIEELERAYKSDPSSRRDPRVPRIAIACLTPKTREKATRFLVEKLGAEARPLLQQAAGGDENSEVRKGAERALERLP